MKIQKNEHKFKQKKSLKRLLNGSVQSKTRESLLCLPQCRFFIDCMMRILF